MQQISHFFDRTDLALTRHFRGNRAGLGRLYAVFSSVFLYLNPFFVKLSRQTNMMSIILVRSGVLVYASFGFLKSQAGERTIPDRHTAYVLILRGVLSTIITFLYYGALVFLPIQIVAVVYQTNTFVTYVLEMLCFGEQYTHVRFLCLVAVVIGLALILNPDLLTLGGPPMATELGPDYFIAALCVLASAVIKGVVNILVKTLKATNPMVNSLFFGGTSTFISGGGFISSQTTFTMSWIGFACLIGSGTASLGYQTFNLKAIGYEDASVVSVFEGLTILYSFAMDVLYFHVKPEVGAVAGSVLVLAALTVLSLSKKKGSAQPRQ